MFIGSAEMCNDCPCPDLKFEDCTCYCEKCFYDKKTYAKESPSVLDGLLTEIIDSLIVS